MEKNDISISVIKRLPRYYRFLENLKENGIVRISSKELAERMGLQPPKSATISTVSAVSVSRDTDTMFPNYTTKSAKFYA